MAGVQLFASPLNCVMVHGHPSCAFPRVLYLYGLRSDTSRSRGSRILSSSIWWSTFFFFFFFFFFGTIMFSHLLSVNRIEKSAPLTQARIVLNAVERRHQLQAQHRDLSRDINCKTPSSRTRHSISQLANQNLPSNTGGILCTSSIC